MAEIIGNIGILLFAGMVFGTVWMFARMKKKEREIYNFSKKLEEGLDAVTSGRELLHYNQEGGCDEAVEDTLWGKISVRLERMQEIWREKEEAGLQEKRQIKELISDISHQTKTPIANLKIYLELLQAEENEERREEFFEKIERQTKKLDFLIQSMVEMSRLETGMIEICQKNTLIYETLGGAVAGIVPKAEQKQIEIYADCREDIRVCHDKKWTEEAFFNILDNAVKYTPAGGKIWIAVSSLEFFTRISIRDNGKGIVKERQAEVFGRFYREPEVHDEEGIGVGLYLARKIVSLQNGYIEVRSEPGEGAEFLIFLPNRDETENVTVS